MVYILMEDQAKATTEPWSKNKTKSNQKKCKFMREPREAFHWNVVQVDNLQQNIFLKKKNMDKF